MRFFLNNLELVLSAAGLIVIGVVPALLQPVLGNTMAVTALTAVVVGLLHGVIFWLIRRRQRQVRQQTISEMRTMLNDVVKNQLAIIALNAQMGRVQERQMKRIDDSVSNIVSALDHLSEESLHHWKQCYMPQNREAIRS
jgi:LytS/YehU family sensor histidine kinase